MFDWQSEADDLQRVKKDKAKDAGVKFMSKRDREKAEAQEREREEKDREELMRGVVEKRKAFMESQGRLWVR